MKKVKKLVLNKEVIAQLSNEEQKSFLGGAPGSSGLLVTCMVCTKGCVCDLLQKPTPTPTPTPVLSKEDGKASPCLNYTRVYSCQDWCNTPTPWQPGH